MEIPWKRRGAAERKRNPWAFIRHKENEERKTKNSPKSRCRRSGTTQTLSNGTSWNDTDRFNLIHQPNAAAHFKMKYTNASETDKMLKQGMPWELPSQREWKQRERSEVPCQSIPKKPHLGKRKREREGHESIRDGFNLFQLRRSALMSWIVFSTVVLGLLKEGSPMKPNTVPRRRETSVWK